MSITIRHEIPAPRSEVWAALADLADHSSWMQDATSVEFVGDQRSGVGTTMRVPTRIGPFRTEDILEVVSWVEGEEIGVIHRGLISGAGEFRLEEVGGRAASTALIWSERLRFPWWLGGPLTAFFAGPILRLIWRGNLARLASRFGKL